MLISPRKSIISIMILCHCTLIVWSGSLTRSVSPEPTSSNVNKTDKFVTLVDSKAKTINVSQLSEARTFSSSLEFFQSIDDAFKSVKNVVRAPLELLGMVYVLLRINKPALVIHHVIEQNPLSQGPIKYFGQRAGQAWKNIANIKNP